MLFKQKSLFFSAIFACVALSHQAQSVDKNIIKITKNNFITEILHGKTLVIVDVFAPWCQSCQQMDPIVKKLAQEFPTVKFVTVNVDEEPELATALEVTSIPTFIILYQGKLITGFAGAKSYDDFKKLIVQILNSNLK